MNQDIRSVKHLDFEIEKEVWNKYQLGEGAELKIRLVLTKVLQKLTHSVPINSDYTGEATTVITVIPQEGYQLYGSAPEKPYSVDELSNATQIDVDFDTIEEPWNIYKIEEELPVRTKLVVSSVSRLIDRFDPYGVPMYVTNSTVLFNVRTKN